MHPTDPLPDWLRQWRHEIGTRMRDARMHRNLTQEALAELVGVERRTILRIELGLHSPSTDRILYIARALDVAPAELMPSADEDE
ncbi:helix-turn-helix transcriptional regulator [Streptomyces sp. NPDC019937]|uniref:helix-turn-helix domain-containing protein n=1 Tax=Streptomyces sp. NPDC019937 TaxID=3154787 RepID=UPI0033D056D0